MVTYALDTNILSFMLKGDSRLISQAAVELASGNRISVPPIVLYEIRRWLLFSNAGKRAQMFDELCRDVLIEDMSRSAFEIAASEHARLKRDGYTLDDADFLIAGFCLDNNYTLVTNNEKHFSLIRNLTIKNWTLK